MSLAQSEAMHFTTAADLRAHYSAVRKRIFAPVVVVARRPIPQAAVRSIVTIPSEVTTYFNFRNVRTVDLSPEVLVGIVATEYRVKRDALLSSDVSKISRARGVVYFLAYHMLGLSRTEIATEFNVPYTTVSNRLATVEHSRSRFEPYLSRCATSMVMTNRSQA